MTPSQQQAMQIVQAQQAQQQPQQAIANGGLGSPPQPFDYQPNPSMDLMRAHVANQQQELAMKAAQQNQQQGYAGYQSDNTAGAVNANPQNDPNTQQTVQAHPNIGWTPNSPEAHQLNIQLADRIKTGTLDPKTAVLAVQSPDVSPEIKQALVSIIQQAQQAQQGGQIGQGMPQVEQQPQSGQGLNPAGPVGQ